MGDRHRWERFSSSDFMHQLFALHKAFIQIHSNLRLFYWSKSINFICLANSIRMSCESEFNHLYYHLSDDGYVLNSCSRRNQCNFLVISLLLYIILCVHYLNGVYFSSSSNQCSTHHWQCICLKSDANYVTACLQALNV